MASNLRVDQILPSTSTNVAIGTATGTVTLSGTTSGTFSGNLTGSVNSTGVTTVTTLNATSIVGVTTAGITTAYISSVNDGPISGARNKITNGDMRIDQRNAGASVTPTSDTTYTVDRWPARLSQASKYSVQQVSDAPIGFVNSLRITSLSSYSVTSTDYFCVDQYIEGLNSSDLAWGTASAKTVTLSFWVKSSLTGTFGGSVFGYQVGYPSYPFSYSISAANTWEYKTITIPGPTSGTFVSTNAGNIVTEFSFGVGSSLSGTAGTWNNSVLYRSATGAVSVVGTNAATWQITGVQLEVGTVATPFERRSYGQELALCQRYYEKSYDIDVTPGTITAVGAELNRPSTTECNFNIRFKVPKRSSTTVTTYSSVTGASGKFRQYDATGQDITSSILSAGTTGVRVFGSISNTGGYGDCQWTASSEL